jgi:prepilin-type N-terminal cleavage/methylation domain-containing protein
MPNRSRQSRCTDPTERGFTIFEMMVVLVIIAMAMTVAPSILAGLEGSRLRAASDELIARLRETRGQAVRRGAATELVLDLTKRTYAMPTEAGFHPLPAVVDAIDVKPQALLQPGGIARIRFLADGTASEARILLRHGGSSAAIAVDWLTGRVHPDG